MEIPFTKQPGIDRRTRRPYQLVIHMDDALKNRWWMTERAELHCSCEGFHRSGECRHVKEKSNEFLRWKRAALRRLHDELCEGLSPETYANTLSDRLDIPLELAQFITRKNGAVAVQFDHGTAQRYGEDCGWGTLGARVHAARDPEEAGALYLVSKEMNFEQWDPVGSVEERFAKPPRLPPSLFKDRSEGDPAEEKKGLYSGQGGVVLLIDRRAGYAQSASLGDAWATFWARLCGLVLVGSGWSGVHRYLPGGDLDGERVGGLAIDLVNCRMMGIKADKLADYSKGVPEEYRNQVGHVHLPWGPEADGYPGGMVIVRHSSKNSLDRDDDLVVLTTNVWQNLQAPESSGVRSLIALAAAYLARMGHNPDAALFYGDWSNPLGQLAVAAESDLVDRSALHWKISDEGIRVLKDTLVPALLSHENLPDLQGPFGADWHLFIPPEQPAGQH